MSKRGRFGKYGEIKRISRLRESKIGAYCTPSERAKATTAFPKKKKTKTPRVTIRTAEGSDVEFIHSLSKKVFSRYGPYEDMLTHWFESEITETLLAFMEKRPVGFAMLGRHQREWNSRQVAELLAIAVEPAKQKSGIGDSLIQEVVRKAGELKVQIVVLHTAFENMPAKRLFKKHGFLPSEVKKGFYPKGQDALLMYKYMKLRSNFINCDSYDDSAETTNGT